MMSQFSEMASSSNFFFDVIFFSCQVKLLVQVSCQGLTWNPEMRNTPVWVLPNIWRPGRVRNTKFGKSLIRCYWILKNGRVTAFTVSELLRENHKRVTVLWIYKWFDDQLSLVGRLPFFFFSYLLFSRPVFILIILFFSFVPFFITLSFCLSKVLLSIFQLV